MNPTYQRHSTKRSKIAAILLASTGLIAAAAFSTPATAQEAAAEQSYAIPAGALADALNSFAEQSGTQLLYEAELTEGKRSKGLRGRYTRTEALSRLLIGTSLAARRTSDNIFSIGHATTGTMQLDPLSVRGAVERADTQDREPGRRERDRDSADTIVVTGLRTDGYQAVDSNALGFDLGTKELPATVNVVTSEFLEDIGARRLGDIVNYLPGVTLAQTQGQNNDRFIVRGFELRNLNVDGVRQAFTSQRRSIDNVERVEIIKGADGVEATAADPGGSLNIVTKKPQRAFGVDLAATGGTYGYHKFFGDITGALPDMDTLQGRLIAGYEKGGLSRPFGAQSEPFLTVAPSINWDYAPSGHVTLQYQFVTAPTIADSGVTYLPGAFPGGFAPRYWSQDMRSTHGRSRSHQASVDVRQNITDFLSAKLFYQRFWSKDREYVLSANVACNKGNDGITYNGDPRLSCFVYSDTSAEENNEFYSGEVKGSFDLWKTRQSITVGASRTIGLGAFANNDYRYDGDDPLIGGLQTDLFHPNNDIVVDLSNPSHPQFFGLNRERITSQYVQWLARWTDRWRTVVGVRHDKIVNTTEFTQLPDRQQFPSGYDNDTYNYRVATSFDITKHITAFASYSDAHYPQNAITRTGSRLKPVGNIGYEAGVKVSLVDGRLLWTNNVFRNKQTDLGIADPTNSPTESFQIPFGDVQIEGVESQLLGKPLPDLDLSASLSLQRDKVVKSQNPDFLGNRFIGTARVQANVFAKYQWTALGLSNLSTGIGISHLGGRAANEANSFFLPGYTRMDLALGWQFDKRFSVDVNLTNVFDKTYYQLPHNGLYTIGDPRVAQATLRYTF